MFVIFVIEYTSIRTYLCRVLRNSLYIWSLGGSSSSGKMTRPPRCINAPELALTCVASSISGELNLNEQWHRSLPSEMIIG